MEELEAEMPDKMKRTIAEKKLEFYTIDASKVAKEIGLGQRINTVMQAVFYHLSGVLPKEEAVQLLKDDIVKLYSKKGPAVVQMNHDAVDASVANLNKIDVPAAWSQATNDTLGYGSGKSNTLGFMLQRLLLQRLYNVPSLTDDFYAFYAMFFNVLMFQCNFNRCYNSFCTD
jgi:pyruvate-ferredoxin/flavodoxin oxidoreductase